MNSLDEVSAGGAFELSLCTLRFKTASLCARLSLILQDVLEIIISLQLWHVYAVRVM